MSRLPNPHPPLPLHARDLLGACSWCLSGSIHFSEGQKTTKLLVTSIHSRLEPSRGARRWSPSPRAASADISLDSRMRSRFLSSVFAWVQQKVREIPPCFLYQGEVYCDVDPKPPAPEETEVDKALMGYCFRPIERR